jgi:peptide/nickel transport system ATP-binding protein
VSGHKLETPTLAVRGLRTVFETGDGAPLVAVDGVSFNLARGEVLGLVGESGSGKSVTGFSLLGLIEPPGRIVAGSVQLAGRELIGLPEDELRRLRGRQIALIFQDPMMTLNPVLRVGTQMTEVLAAHGLARGAAAREEAARWLAAMGVAEPAARLDAWPHQLSGGLRQRVAIATALMTRPAVVVADEPTTALDVTVQGQILSEVQKLVATSGTALLWITHDLSVVAALADRVAVMYAGRIVETGPTAALLAAPRHPYTAGLLRSLPSRAVRGQPLRPIPGQPPRLGGAAVGCAFAPRCERAAARCTEEAPGLSDDALAPARQWRCWQPHPVPESRPL